MISSGKFGFVKDTVLALLLVTVTPVALEDVNIMTPDASGAAVTQAAVAAVHTVFGSDNDFLRRIAYVESKDGRDSNTYRQGYEGGIWQVDQVGFDDTQSVSSHPGLTNKYADIQRVFGIDWTTVQWSDLRKPLYSALAARLFLSNIPEAFPPSNDVRGQGEYWKEHYNTASGAGTVDKFVEDVSTLPASPPSGVDGDPHFLLHVPHGNVTICFDVRGNPGDIFNLVEDSELGLSINARVQTFVTHPELLKRGKTSANFLKSTIFDQMAITTVDYRILVTLQNITINDLTMSWRSGWSIVKGNSSLSVSEGKYLNLQMNKDVHLIVMLHAINKNHPGESAYLGLYVEQADGFSHRVHGIIGQFQQSKVFLYSESVYTDNNQNVFGELRVNNRTVKVRHINRRVALTGDVVPCWYASNNGKGIIDGSYTDYAQNFMFKDS